jgi:hypothetical protein
VLKEFSFDVHIIQFVWQGIDVIYFTSPLTECVGGQEENVKY